MLHATRKSCLADEWRTLICSGLCYCGFYHHLYEARAATQCKVLCKMKNIGKKNTIDLAFAKKKKLSLLPLLNSPLCAQLGRGYQEHFWLQLLSLSDLFRSAIAGLLLYINKFCSHCTHESIGKHRK